MTMKAKNKSLLPATGKDIKTITGLEDNGLIASILGIGATPAEVMLAFQWLENGDCKCPETRKSMDIKIKQVCDILEAHRDMNDMSERL